MVKAEKKLFEVCLICLRAITEYPSTIVLLKRHPLKNEAYNNIRYSYANY